jgi:hypothetical protein
MANGGKRPGAGRKLGSLGQQAAGLRAAFDRLEASSVINRDRLIRQAWRIAMMRTSSPAKLNAVTRAIDIVFDRWFGRAPQAIEVSDPAGGALFPKELPEKIEALIGLAAKHRGKR